MTRAVQKRGELELLRHALSRLEINCTSIEERERPDFVLNIAGHRIGVELTEYHSNPCRRAVEESWRRISDELDEVRQHDSGLRRVSLSLELSSMRLPKANQRSRFCQELVEFVRDMEGQLGSDYIYAKPDSEQWPEISAYVRRMRLRKVKSYIHWKCSNLEFGGVGGSEQEWLCVLHKKLHSNFEFEVDENWLFVAGGHRLSQVMGTFFVNRLKNFNRLAKALQESQYHAVFICQWEIVRWSRAFGWEELTGTERRGHVDGAG